MRDSFIVRHDFCRWPLTMTSRLPLRSWLTHTTAPAATVTAAGPAVDESLALHEQLRRFHAASALRFGMERMVGNSPAMRRARAQAKAAAASKASVLLLGPVGSGRRQMAEAIHLATANADSALLVPIDCVTLNAEMIVSAVQDLLAQPAKGRVAVRSFLLCKVDHLDIEAQTSLATLFRAAELPFRLMSTAGAALVDMARRKQFNEELAATLSTITIELPPLAERLQDVPQLAQSLLEQSQLARQQTSWRVYSRGLGPIACLFMARQRYRIGRDCRRLPRRRGRSLRSIYRIAR